MREVVMQDIKSFFHTLQSYEFYIGLWLYTIVFLSMYEVYWYRLSSVFAYCVKGLQKAVSPMLSLYIKLKTKIAGVQN